MRMNHASSTGRVPQGRMFAAMLLALCLVAFAGCSGEVYDPSAATLSLEEGDGRLELSTETTTGAVLEIPDGDPFANAPHVLRADFLNTGESDAILIRMDDTVILIDTGESDDYATISGRLDEYGITVIDHLILTHFDNDHIGSAAQILQDFTVGAVYMPDYVRDSVLYRRMMGTLDLLSDTAVHRVTEDVTIGLAQGDLVISPTELYASGLVLGSDDSHALEENNYSLITTVSFGEIRMLFMGDAEQARLREFMEELDGEPDYDLIKIPHHGGYDKALGDLLRGCGNLRYCVVHTGDKSQVDASLITAMRSVGAAAYYTFGGDVRFATDGESMVMTQE